MVCTKEILFKEAARLGLPRHYASDLNIDARVLEEEFGTLAPVFGWVIYDCGTHLINPVAPVDGTGQDMVTIYRRVFKTMFNTDRHCYVWTGTELKAMRDADAMCDYLVPYVK